MELLKLKDNVLGIFQTDIEHLGEKLMAAVNNNRIDLYDQFCEAVGNDLTVDWLQMIFQYYHADRKEKKQDYTPKSIAEFMSRLIGNSDGIIVDMCAGSGALTIQRWALNPSQRFRLLELDEKVIPYLLFNLVIRNIDSSVCRADVLQCETYEQWRISKGEKYGRITYFKPTV